MQLSRFFSSLFPAHGCCKCVRQGAKTKPISVIATVLSKAKKKKAENERMRKVSSVHLKKKKRRRKRKKMKYKVARVESTTAAATAAASIRAITSDHRSEQMANIIK